MRLSGRSALDDDLRMGRSAIKLILVGLVLNAIWQTAPVFWHFAQFEDEVLEVAKLSTRATREDVLRKVLVLAERHEMPLAPEDLKIDRRGDRTTVRASFVVDLEYFPRRIYPWRFDLDVVGSTPRLSSIP